MHLVPRESRSEVGMHPDVTIEERKPRLTSKRNEFEDAHRLAYWQTFWQACNRQTEKGEATSHHNNNIYLLKINVKT